MMYLIDGHNLIGHMPNIALGDEHDEVHLILTLRSWAAQNKRRQLLVIFDAGLPGGKRPKLSNNQIEVEFAPAGMTADKLLIQFMMGVGNSTEYMLVSSDREIIKVAETKDIAYLTSKQFMEHMKEDKRVQKKPPPVVTNKHSPVVSESEINEWLELFGPVEVKPPPRHQGAVNQSSSNSPTPSSTDPKRKPKPKRPTVPASEYKKGHVQLDDDELNEWLDLFNTKDNKKK